MIAYFVQIWFHLCNITYTTGLNIYKIYRVGLCLNTRLKLLSIQRPSSFYTHNSILVSGNSEINKCAELVFSPENRAENEVRLVAVLTVSFETQTS